MLQIEKICKKFAGNPVLKNISLDIKPGTITCVIGPSGAGKTTLLRTIGMLELPDSGRISIDDESYKFPLKSITGREPWPKTTIVFQQLFIWPHLTIRENILLPIGKNISSEKYKQFEKLVKTFRMNSFLDRYPNQASLGQKQRAAIVRALMLNPKYLLLDEITASLDVQQATKILSHLSLIKEQGVGILMVAHDIDFALSIADKVIFMDKGAIIKEGKPYEFLMESENSRISKFIQDAFLGSPDIRIYTGAEEFQAYHLNLMKQLPAGSTAHIIGAVGDTWYTTMGEKYQEYVKLRTKKKIIWKMLMYEHGPEEAQLVKNNPQLNIFHVISRDVKNMANINIMSNGIMILQIFNPIPTIIEIKNPIIAKSYLNYYEDLLKSSKPFEIK
jgi:ABC-type polar amino acid transport system ATPase subunit